MVVLTHLAGKGDGPAPRHRGGRGADGRARCRSSSWSLMGVAVLAYVVLDGYDLGVGMLMPAGDATRSSRSMVASIGPFWDANETWLVLGIGILLVAFPLAHGVVLRRALPAGGRRCWSGSCCAASPSSCASRPRAGTASCGTGSSGRARSSPRSSQGADARALHHRLRAGLRLLAVRARGRRERCAAATCCSARRGSSCKTEGALRRKAIGLGALGAAAGSRSASRW